MLSTKKKEKVVTFPLSVFETADTKEDLEDWLLSQNPEFIKKMRGAKRSNAQGKGKDWKSLKKELCILSNEGGEGEGELAGGGGAVARHYLA